MVLLPNIILSSQGRGAKRAPVSESNQVRILRVLGGKLTSIHALASF